MAKSILFECWSGEYLNNTVIDVIDKHFPDDITVTISNKGTHYMNKLEQRNDLVRIFIHPAALWNDEWLSLERGFVNDYDPDRITLNNGEFFDAKVWMGMERYPGIGVLASLRSSGSSKKPIAKVVSSRVMYIGFDISIAPQTVITYIFDELTKYSLMNQDEYNKAYLKFSRENLRDFIFSHHKIRYDQMCESIRSNEAKIAKHMEDITSLKAANEELKAQLVTLDDLLSSSVVQAINEVNELDKIEGIEWHSGTTLFNSGLLQVRTKPIYCRKQGRRFLFGRYLVTFDFFKSSVKFENADGLNRKSYWGENCPHPHISSDGSACLGNIRTDISNALQSFSFSYAIILALAFLRQANINDSAGRYFVNWPLVDDEGNIIADNGGIILTCSNCHTIHPDEPEQEWANCEMCGNLVCPDCAEKLELNGRTLHLCPECSTLGVSTCNVCGEQHIQSDMISTYFGQSVCEHCCRHINIIRMSDDDTSNFVFTTISVTEQDIENKIGVCTKCNNQYIIGANDHGECAYCANGGTVHTCDDCGAVCSDSNCIIIRNDNEEPHTVCLACYEDYSSCMTCMNTYPTAEMYPVNSDVGLYQCSHCHEEMLREDDDENVQN